MSLLRLNRCKPVQNKESKETYDIIYDKNLYRAKINYEKYESYQFYKPSINVDVFRDLVEKNIEKTVPFLNQKTGEIWIEIPIFHEYFIKIFFEKVNFTFSQKKRIEDLEKEIEELKKGIHEDALIAEFPLPKWDSLEEFFKLSDYKYIEMAQNWKNYVKTLEIDENFKEIFHETLITDGTKQGKKYYLYLTDLNGEKYVLPFKEQTSFFKGCVNPSTGNYDDPPCHLSNFYNRKSFPVVSFPTSYKVPDISQGFAPLGININEYSAVNIWQYGISSIRPVIKKFYKHWTYADFQDRGYSRGLNKDGTSLVTERFFEKSENTLSYNLPLYFLYLAFGWVVENLDCYGKYELTFKICADGKDNIKMNIYRGKKIEPYDFLETPLWLLFGNFQNQRIPTLY